MRDYLSPQYAGYAGAYVSLPGFRPICAGRSPAAPAPCNDPVTWYLVRVRGVGGASGQPRRSVAHGVGQVGGVAHRAKDPAELLTPGPVDVGEPALFLARLVLPLGFEAVQQLTPGEVAEVVPGEVIELGHQRPLPHPESILIPATRRLVPAASSCTGRARSWHRCRGSADHAPPTRSSPGLRAPG